VNGCVVGPEPIAGPVAPPPRDDRAEFGRLIHQLNNQLGIILANAELLESRLSDTTHRARAGQVAASALDAIATTQQLRRLLGADPTAEANRVPSAE
jgi:hypothetical protein